MEKKLIVGVSVSILMVVLVSIFLLTLVFQSDLPQEDKIIPYYTIDEVWQKLQDNENILIIDTRISAEYIESHIPTAVNLEFDYRNITMVDVELIESYNKKENILHCHCYGGATAQYIVSELIDLGMNNVYYMNDSFNLWSYRTVNGTDPGN